MANQFEEADYKGYFEELSKQNLTPYQLARKVTEDTKLLESQGYTVDPTLVNKYLQPIVQPKLDAAVGLGSNVNVDTSSGGITTGTGATPFTDFSHLSGLGDLDLSGLGSYTPPASTSLTAEQQKNIRDYAQRSANTFEAGVSPQEILQQYTQDLSALPEGMRAEAEKIFAEELEANRPGALEQFRQAIATPDVTTEVSGPVGPTLGGDVPTIDVGATTDSGVRVSTPEETAGVTVDIPEVTPEEEAIEKFKAALPENMQADYQFIVDNPERFIVDGRPNVQALADYLKDKGFSFAEAMQLTGLTTDNPLFAEAQAAYGVSDEDVDSLIEDGSLSSGERPTEAALGSIVPGAPQVGEINILDYLGLQAGEPTLPVGTKLSSVLAKIKPTVGADGEMLELLPDISTADKTKLGTEDVTATATKVTSEVGGTTTVPGQVTVPTAADVTTDIVEASEFTEAGVPSQFIDPVTGELKTEDNLQTMAAKKSYSDIDDEAKSFTAAKQELAEVNPLATVTGQLAILQEQFADGEVPVWASGAFRTVNALMAQRGIGGSTMAAEAITNALMQSALPIAQQDASFYQNVTLQNLSNEQQTEMAKFNARTSAIFNDQAAVNAARSLNTQEENALTRFFAELATNVSTTNAQMSNSMEQFNATAKNQMSQFIEELALTAETFNADAINEMSQFDAEQANIISQFNAGMKDQRERFNVQNQLAIDASNVNWRREVNTANTAATNAALQFDAQNLLAVQQTALNNIWQHYDSLLDFAFRAEEGAMDRASNLAIASMSAEMQQQIAEAEADTGLISSIFEGGTRLLASESGKSLFSELLDI